MNLKEHLEAIRDTPDIIASDEQIWQHAIDALEILKDIEALVATNLDRVTQDFGVRNHNP